MAKRENLQSVYRHTALSIENAEGGQLDSNLTFSPKEALIILKKNDFLYVKTIEEWASFLRKNHLISALARFFLEYEGTKGKALWEVAAQVRAEAIEKGIIVEDD